MQSIAQRNLKETIMQQFEAGKIDNGMLSVIQRYPFLGKGLSKSINEKLQEIGQPTCSRVTIWRIVYNRTELTAINKHIKKAFDLHKAEMFAIRGIQEGIEEAAAVVA